MPAKKAAKKTAAKTTAKKAVKKVAKEASKKVARKTAPASSKPGTEKPSGVPTAVKMPSTDAIARLAYLNYLHRMQNGLPGDAHGDWIAAERKLLQG